MSIDIEYLLCPTPKTMIIDLCKDCKLATKEIIEGREYEQYFPTRKLMGGYQCEGHTPKD